MEFPKAYAAIYKDEKVRLASQSGGAFSAISNCTLEDRGAVYGCAMTDIFSARHIKAEDVAGRDRMRGSKYIQSIMDNTFSMIRKDLQERKRILFSGTPCQVAGLKNYIRDSVGECENLLCVDLVCHGVPSPKVWKVYLEYIEMCYGRKITKVNFRAKERFGWHSHKETWTLEDGEYGDADYFATMFYGHYILRPSCFECPFKSLNRTGDITIADCWGVESVLGEMDDNKGVSLILVNTKRGEEIFERIKPQMLCKQVELDGILQPALVAPDPEPLERTVFWKDFANRKFDYLIKKYCTPTLAVKLKRKVYRITVKGRNNKKEDRRKACCGCTACYAICPKEAIDMVEDEEGFLYPKVNMDKCIHCQKCLHVCPIVNAKGGIAGYEGRNSYISF